jgi:putative colanic acid biosysnthesis UDP-glucose lipid carrier transferase
MERFSNRVIKRSLDIFFSVIIVSLCIWLFVLISIIQKFIFHSVVLFKQVRTGQNNRIFYCYKISTVSNGQNIQNTKIAGLKSKFDTFLRVYRIDEFPQFFNVIAGNMSIVGPRPLVPHEIDKYFKSPDEVNLRHMIKPGITGLAQISLTDEKTISEDTMRKKMDADLLYYHKWSPVLDLRIMLLTPIFLMSHKPVNMKFLV